MTAQNPLATEVLGFYDFSELRTSVFLVAVGYQGTPNSCRYGPNNLIAQTFLLFQI